MPGPIPNRLPDLVEGMHAWDPKLLGRDFVDRINAGAPSQADYDFIVAEEKKMNRGTWVVAPEAPVDPYQARRMGMAQQLRAIRLEMESYPDIKAAGFRGVLNALFDR